MASEGMRGIGARQRGPGRTRPGGRPEIDAAARAYLFELAQRYVPFLLIVAVLLFLVVQAPTTRPKQVTIGAGGVGAQSALGALGSQTGANRGSAADHGGSVSRSGTTGSRTASGGQASSGGSAAVGTATATGRGSTAAAGTNPYAVSGVKCGPGVLQVPWSPYAPPCMPAWHGNNGGATAPGVTATTITLTYREEGESSDVSAMRSVMPGVIPTDSQALFDLNVLLQAFNREFELYGRHVVIKPYPAQGDALQEMVGQDTQGAQEDAATAASMGAFADITPIPTPLYAQALVQNHVVSFNNLLSSTQFLSSSAPYAYTLVPALDVLGGLLKTVGCQVGSMPVSFAGNTSLNGKHRVFGLIVPENPEFQGLESKVLSGLKACGVAVPVVINYALNLSTVQQEMQNAVSQMKANNVTTVVCGCDPTGEIYVTQAADQQNYYPEWISEWLPDQFERLFSQDQWSHSIEFGLGSAIPEQENEAYKVFKMVDPSGQPAEPLYMFLYYQLMYVFDGLQAAGPDLTPSTMLAGIQHLPTTASGQTGEWFHGGGIYWPFSEAQLSYWAPNKVSAADGKQGDYSPCFGGQWFSEFQTTFPRSLSCPGQPP